MRPGFSALGPSVLLALVLSLACESTDPPNQDGTGGGDGEDGAGGTASGGATTETGGSTNEGSGGSPYTPLERSACGLPLFGATGQPAPSGDAGGLEVVDWAGATFAVSYTFDDSNSSQISAYPELKALGVPMTFYLQTGKDESSDAVWAEALDDGHELGNHTESHAQTGTGTDIDAATMFIEETFGVAPMTMAAPYGDDSYIPLAEERFFINRGVPGGSVAPGGSTNPFNLPCYVPPTGATADVMNGIMDTARTGGRWQLVLVHGFTGGSDAAFQPVPLADFLSHVQYTRALEGVWVDTVLAVGAYFLGQKAFAAAEETTDGDSTTWTWTLPDHFPQDRCIRVVVDGGTLEQDGQALTWDDHGYYEVDLDAGSLTLSP